MRKINLSVKVLFPAVFILFLIIYLLTQGLMNHAISRCEADINHDGIDESLELTGGNQYADFLTILSGNREIYRIDLKPLKPWKVQTADVEGDGRIDISIGVYKTTRADSSMQKRPFIYDWDEKGLHPKWLGSCLSRPFDDYIFYDLDGDGMDELISIEYLADGTKALNSYKWKGFGFEGIAGSGSYSDIKALKTAPKGEKPPEAEILDNGKWKRISVFIDGDRLVLK